jgi:hypothetical protein
VPISNEDLKEPSEDEDEDEEDGDEEDQLIDGENEDDEGKYLNHDVPVIDVDSSRHQILMFPLVLHGRSTQNSLFHSRFHTRVQLRTLPASLH